MMTKQEISFINEVEVRSNEVIGSLYATIEDLMAQVEALQPKATTKPKTKKLGIGAFVKGLLQAEETKALPSKALLELVLKEFPEAQTTVACIAWYKNNIKK